MRGKENKTKDQIEYGGIKIPKLDLTKIYASREMQTLALLKQQEGEDDQDSSSDNYEPEENTHKSKHKQVDSATRKALFEQQKKAFKDKMGLKNGSWSLYY